ncbi:CDF family Co(II)/Ni(II) efflux transporter DmeF [Phyllobacterium sp. 21LDTY02-6]|jgi:cation diffusion facilitator family transporter|uniref:CDF family Co(II)/Ni(II) efflux transporter DmeF n=1 Tax=unclassified Phyllobacterium TaxID=2638441 RepID=UPI0020205103|nr:MULTISPECIES: CDF family Co(II)/Ni(II) efflux transporter DmeF [unclassified Phyllobacterium]MCO4319506.1 CDF family Co(II)/Ni(II) efflux transporter DmeF [Phyllobacterium sp. 21LDTY02-6]MCX8279732.1 CDF family Co(II)/Ni(II) efflux transporter DmeF [Phyllobacterium sp. 0TCS1.6C]MCX8295664.1 CDF family Co(II)/Ni(II) efflux transporter DmeF [Phyllobacterium sp. 0TCS1.6A]
MTQLDATSDAHGHGHVFLGDDHERNERRTWFVIALTATMMVAEIAAGTMFGSMALVADGWHMSTHAAALLIAALAYLYARRNARNPRFTFGTGKLGDLAAFASAVVLALIALLIGWESLLRLSNPIEISFPQAISVAVIGLLVNLACAWLLRDDHHHHGHDHGHDHHAHDHHEHHAHGGDNNLRAAYMHVLADALTSVLAIVALLAGSVYGWLWLDPAMGLVGAAVIARWSWNLIRDAGRVLLDYIPPSEDLPDEIRAAIESDGDRITDLHVWQLGPGHHGAIVALLSDDPMPPSAYRAKLAHIHDLSHVTVEVEPRLAA